MARSLLREGREGIRIAGTPGTPLLSDGLRSVGGRGIPADGDSRCALESQVSPELGGMGECGEEAKTVGQFAISHGIPRGRVWSGEGEVGSRGL